MANDLYGVYGAAGCGRGIMPIAREQLAADNIDVDQLVFVDDFADQSNINGHRVMTYADFAAHPANNRSLAIAIADSSVRADLAQKIDKDGIAAWSVRAANAEIMDSVTIGDGALISPFATITSNIQIGQHVHCNLYCYIEHDCNIGDFVTFAPGAKCNGNVTIEDHAYIGSGAVIKQGTPDKPLVIGKHAVIGMGAVVLCDVREGEVIVGNPGKPLRKDAP